MGINEIRMRMRSGIKNGIKIGKNKKKKKNLYIKK